MKNILKIKVCGITNKKDAIAASELGVDFLGFVFAPSLRRISPQKAAEIIACLPPDVCPVGVFVDEKLKDLNRIIRFCGLRRVQLHGNEPPDYALTLPVPVIRAVRIYRRLMVPTSFHYPAEAFLLDPRNPHERESGIRSFDWPAAAGADFPGRIFIAGGLTPENVRRSVVAVRPYGVDVSSGVESEPGQKDVARMRKFVCESRAGGSL